MVSALENIWNQISQAYQAHVAFSLFSLGAYIVGIACVMIIASVSGSGELHDHSLEGFLSAAARHRAAHHFDAAVQRLVALLRGWLNSVVQYAVLQILVYAFLAFYLSDRHSVGFREPLYDDEQRQRRLVGARAFRADRFDGNVFAHSAPCARGVDFRRHAHVGAYRWRSLARILRPPGTAAVANARVPFLGWRGLNGRSPIVRRRLASGASMATLAQERCKTD